YPSPRYPSPRYPSPRYPSPRFTSAATYPADGIVHAVGGGRSGGVRPADDDHGDAQIPGRSQLAFRERAATVLGDQDVDREAPHQGVLRVSGIGPPGQQHLPIG